MLFLGGGPPSLLAVGNCVIGLVGGAATRLAFCLVTVLAAFVTPPLSLLLLPHAANSRALQARAKRLNGTRRLRCDRISLSSIDGQLGVALDQTELQAADLVDRHLLLRELGGDPPFAKYVGAVAEIADLLVVGGGEHDRGAGFRGLPDQRVDHGLRADVDP